MTFRGWLFMNLKLLRILSDPDDEVFYIWPSQNHCQNIFWNTHLASPDPKGKRVPIRIFETPRIRTYSAAAY